MADYEVLHYDKDKLREASVPLGIIVVENDADLEQVRKHINSLVEDAEKSSSSNSTQLNPSWCFVDSTTAERFFRIDRAQEHLHYVTDISSEDLYILDPELRISFMAQDNLSSGHRQSNGSVLGSSSPLDGPPSTPGLLTPHLVSPQGEGRDLVPRLSPPVIVQDAEVAEPVCMSAREPHIDRLKFTFRSMSLPEQPQPPRCVINNA